MAPRRFFCVMYAFCLSSSSSSSSSAATAPPCEDVHHFPSDLLCSERLSAVLEPPSSSEVRGARIFRLGSAARFMLFIILARAAATSASLSFLSSSSGVCDFRILLLGFTARFMLFMILARAAATSASLTLSSSFSSSEGTSNQPGCFDRPFFLGVAFLTAIPFLITDFAVPEGTFFVLFGDVGVDEDDGEDGWHVAQSHSLGREIAVIWAQSQWYHPMAQSGLSQRIQFSELSGLPQMQM